MLNLLYLKKFLQTCSELLRTKRNKATFIIFFGLLLVAHFSTIAFWDGWVEGCNSSPYYKFKETYCGNEGPVNYYVNFHAQNTLVPVSTLVRAGVIKFTPLFDGKDIGITPFWTKTDIAYADTKPPIGAILFFSLFNILDILTLAGTSLLLLFAWNKNIFGKVAATMVILLAFSIYLFYLFMVISHLAQAG